MMAEDFNNTHSSSYSIGIYVEGNIHSQDKLPHFDYGDIIWGDQGNPIHLWMTCKCFRIIKLPVSF